MTWFVATSCATASDVGWSLGAYGGLFIDLAVVAMLLVSLSYRRGVRDTAKLRLWAQSLLRFSPWIPVGIWAVFAFKSGSALFPCYAPQIALGASAALAPAVALLMLAAANYVGRLGAR